MMRHLLWLSLVPAVGSLPSATEEPASEIAVATRGEAKPPEIEAIEEIADLALIPPKMNMSRLPEYGYDRLDYGMTIGIERTQNSHGGRTLTA